MKKTIPFRKVQIKAMLLSFISMFFLYGCMEKFNYLHLFERLERELKEMDRYCFESSYESKIIEWQKYADETDLLELKNRALSIVDSLKNVQDVYKKLPGFGGCFENETEMNNLIYTMVWLQENGKEFCEMAAIVDTNKDPVAIIDSLGLNTIIYRTLLVQKKSMCR